MFWTKHIYHDIFGVIVAGIYAATYQEIAIRAEKTLGITMGLYCGYSKVVDAVYLQIHHRTVTPMDLSWNLCISNKLT